VNHKVQAKSTQGNEYQQNSSSDGGGSSALGLGVQVTKTSVQKRAPNDGCPNHKIQSSGMLNKYDGNDGGAQIDARRLKSSVLLQSGNSPQKLEYHVDKEANNIFSKKTS
jgi:hypothetical protein